MRMHIGAISICTTIIVLLLSGCGATAQQSPVSSSLQPTAFAAQANALPQNATVSAVMITPVPATTPLAISTTPTGDAKAAVLAAMQKQFTNGPYRSETESTSGNNTFKIRAEIIPPDRIHMINYSGTEPLEMIIVGDKSWIKQGNTWVAGGANINTGDVFKELMLNSKNYGVSITNVAFVRADVVDGKPAWRYKYDIGFGSGASAAAQNTQIWIGATTGLPLRQEIVIGAGGVKRTTVQTISYDPSITIEPPVK